MKLSQLIAIWDILHVVDTGDIGFCDLCDAIETQVPIHNDIPSELPFSPKYGRTYYIS